MLGSRLKEKNLLSPNTKFAWYRNREVEFRQFFRKVNSLVYCHDIGGLVRLMGFEYNAKERRLFIDSSMKSLKEVLLYNGNRSY